MLDLGRIFELADRGQKLEALLAFVIENRCGGVVRFSDDEYTAWREQTLGGHVEDVDPDSDHSELRVHYLAQPKPMPSIDPDEPVM